MCYFSQSILCTLRNKTINYAGLRQKYKNSWMTHTFFSESHCGHGEGEGEGEREKGPTGVRSAELGTKGQLYIRA